MMFHLDSLWHEDARAMEFALTNCGETAVANPRLCYGSLTRALRPSQATGAQLLRRQANYHEYAAPEGFVLHPGETWRFTEASLTRPAKHSNEGPKSAALLLEDGTMVPVFASDLQAEQAFGVARVADNQALTFGVLPQPQGVAVHSWQAVAPVHLAVAARDAATLQAVSQVAALTRRLHPLVPVPFVLTARDDVARLEITADESLAPDGYSLSWQAGQVTLRHGAGQGLLHGLVTLAQALTSAHMEPQRYGVPLEGTVTDAPRHGWRGAHLDVSRQFYPLDQVLRYVDILAWHKMNRFHWHLTDDEGWRLEIKSYPALTESAAQTGMGHPVLPQLGPDMGGQGGYYTQAEARQVVRHASALGVEVMPEIDIPGHCACVLGALPALVDQEEPESYWSVQGFANNALNPAIEASYTFAEKVLAEVCEVFPFEIVHVGGDEVAEGAWMKSPKAQAMMRETGLKDTHELQAYFLRHIQEFLAGLGRKLGGWEEVAHGGGVKPENTLLFAWTTVEKTAELAEAGYDVVSTPGQAYYLDMALSEAWYAPGASWAGFTPLATTYAFEANNGAAALQERLKGVQACVWSEHLTTMARKNHMIFPRLSAIAEAGWSAAEAKDFARFEALAALMPRL